MHPVHDPAAFSRVPVNALHGLELVASGGGRAEIHMEPRAEHLQEEGVVHGAILTLLADTTAVYCLNDGLPADHAMTSIEFKLNFLRPALPERGPLVARGAAVQHGRKVGLVEVDVFQADKPVAKGLFTYLFFQRSG